MAKKHKKRDKAKRVTAGKRSRRTYAGAKTGRLMFTAATSSADQELYSSLRVLRDRSRALVRDVVYAARAKAVTVNNVIGQGVGMQGQVKQLRGDKLLTKVNAGIERAWRDWSLAEHCHTGAALHFADLERLAMAEVFEAGEVFIRKHFRQFGDSRVPLGLEVIEAERLADDHEIQAPAGAVVRLGIEQDEFGRPLAYYVHRHHPNELRGPRVLGEIIRVPAEQMLHLRLVDRWPQARGVPALHAAIARLDQLGEYENAALVAARIGASKVGFFESQEWAQTDKLGDGEEADGTQSTTVEAGEFTELPPGYTFKSWDPNYPVDAFDPFTRACLRGIAAGVGVSYESLSRDYSQSNYSSSRLSLLDDRDLWRVLQAWWVRAFREPLHRTWLQQAVFANAIPELGREQYAADPVRFSEVRFKPRGWGWVDPSKEVKAYKEAERAGYVSKSDIIAATGGGNDIEDVIAARRRELDLLDEAALKTDTTTAADAGDVPPPAAETETDETDDQAPTLVAVGADK